MKMVALIKGVANTGLAILTLCLLIVYSVWGSDLQTINLEKKSISEYLQSEQEVSIFFSALQLSKHWSDVRTAEQITLFVPDNQSLRKEGAAFLLEEVLVKPENRERLNHVMGLHMVNGSPLDLDAGSSIYVRTIDGECFLIERKNGVVKIGPQAAVTKSIVAGNGRVYLIDRILWTPYQETDRVCQ